MGSWLSTRSIGVWWVALLWAGPLQADGEIQGQRPPCVTVRQQTFNAGVGFNHLVHVRNACAQAVRCQVTTDVNPSPTTVQVAPGEEQLVNTFLHAPGPGFRPRVECETSR